GRGGAAPATPLVVRARSVGAGGCATAGGATSGPAGSTLMSAGPFPPAARRRRVDRGTIGRDVIDQPVPATDDGLDELRVVVGAQLPAQRPHRHAHGVGERVG